MLPNISHLWFQLASFQAAALQESQSSPTHQPVDGLLVARCAQIAAETGQHVDTSTTDEQHIQQIDVSKVTSLVAIGYLLAGQKKASLIAAQKAVHSNPQSAASWSVLLAAAVSSWTSETSQPSDNQILWLKQLIGHLRRRCDVAAFSGLAAWLGSYERRLTGLLSQNWKEEEAAQEGGGGGGSAALFYNVNAEKLAETEQTPEVPFDSDSVRLLPL